MEDIFHYLNRGRRFHLTFIVTHSCNLSCVYCYENAKSGKIIDENKIYEKINLYLNDIAIGDCEISFFGGEPILCFDMIKRVCEWTWSKTWVNKYIFFITTNGTLFNKEIKNWFSINRKRFYVALSLDGTKKTHDKNRSNSFDSIDLDYFLSNWPDQPIKMTVNVEDVNNIAENIIFIHKLGFLIEGSNFAEGIEIDYEANKTMLITQFDRLLEYYNSNEVIPAPILNLRIENCEAKATPNKKWCGVGTDMIVYDVDMKNYPCTYFTPLTFSEEKINEILRINFFDSTIVEDKECANCYIKCVCPTCYGANYQKYGEISKKDKSKCEFIKLRALYSAKILSNKFLKNKEYYIQNYPKRSLMLINAILKINRGI